MLLPATVTARPRFLFTAFPLVIPVAAWWSHRDRIGWELTLVACGAGPRDPHRSVRGLRGDPVRLAGARRPPLGVVVLGLLAYVPALTAGRGRMPADTKLYLYLDPGRLVVRRAVHVRRAAVRRLGAAPDDQLPVAVRTVVLAVRRHRRTRLDRPPAVDRHDPVRRRPRCPLARPPARDRRLGRRSPRRPCTSSRHTCCRTSRVPR